MNSVPIRSAEAHAHRSLRTERAVLATIWVSTFLLLFALLLALFLGSWIETDSFTAALKAVGSVFAPFVGFVVGFYAACSKAERSQARREGPFLIALASSVLFCGALLAALACVLFGITAIERFTALTPELAGGLSCVTAPTLSYYFVRGN